MSRAFTPVSEMEPRQTDQLQYKFNRKRSFRHSDHQTESRLTKQPGQRTCSLFSSPTRDTVARFFTQMEMQPVISTSLQPLCLSNPSRRAGGRANRPATLTVIRVKDVPSLPRGGTRQHSGPLSLLLIFPPSSCPPRATSSK